LSFPAGDGRLSLAELTSYLAAVYAVSERLGLPLPSPLADGEDGEEEEDEGGNSEAPPLRAEAAARRMAAQAFVDVGRRPDPGASLSMEEFARVFIGELPHEA